MVCQKHLELKNKFNSAYLIHLGLQSSTNFTETLEVIWFFLMISHNILKLLSKVHSLLGFHVTSFFCKHMSLKSQWNYLTRTERGPTQRSRTVPELSRFCFCQFPAPVPPGSTAAQTIGLPVTDPASARSHIIKTEFPLILLFLPWVDLLAQLL